MPRSLLGVGKNLLNGLLAPPVKLPPAFGLPVGVNPLVAVLPDMTGDDPGLVGTMGTLHQQRALAALPWSLDI